MPLQIVESPEEIVFDPNWCITKQIEDPEKKDSLFKALSKNVIDSVAWYVGSFPLIPENIFCHAQLGSTAARGFLLDKVCFPKTFNVEEAQEYYSWFLKESPWKNAFEKAIIVFDPKLKVPISYLFPHTKLIQYGLYTSNALLASRQYSEHIAQGSPLGFSDYASFWDSKELKNKSIFVKLIALQKALGGWHCCLNRNFGGVFDKDLKHTETSNMSHCCNKIWYSTPPVDLPKDTKALLQFAEERNI